MSTTYAGVDWASEKHDVLIADETGEEILAATFAHDEAGLRGLCRTLQLLGAVRPGRVQWRHSRRQRRTGLEKPGRTSSDSRFPTTERQSSQPSTALVQRNERSSPVGSRSELRVAG